MSLVGCGERLDRWVAVRRAGGRAYPRCINSLARLLPQCNKWRRRWRVLAPCESRGNDLQHTASPARFVRRHRRGAAFPGTHSESSKGSTSQEIGTAHSCWSNSWSRPAICKCDSTRVPGDRKQPWTLSTDCWARRELFRRKPDRWGRAIRTLRRWKRAGSGKPDDRSLPEQTSKLALLPAD